MLFPSAWSKLLIETSGGYELALHDSQAG